MKQTKKSVECAKIYGVATQSASHVYDALKSSGDDLVISYVPVGSSTIEDCDVVVVAGVETLFNVAEYLHSNMQVIVSDGPLLLFTVKNIVNVDYSNEEVSYVFKFSRLNSKSLYRNLVKVYKTKKNIPVGLENTTFDVLGLIQQGTISGDFILSLYNRVSSSFDMLARNEFKRLFVKSLTEDTDPKPLLNFLNAECVSETHRSDAKKFLSKYSKHRKSLISAIKLISEKKSVEFVSKKYDIPAFELNYIRKLKESISKVEEKTSLYNKRALSEVA